MAFIKSMQYLLLKLIHSTLARALADNLQTPFDALFNQLIKEMRILTKSGRLLPCSDTFYAELFSVGY
jgi:hypothetical protein